MTTAGADILSVLSPLPPRNSTCGYCGSPGKRSQKRSNYHYAECDPQRLSCATYQRMIDCGWRRSGTYCYKPDLKRSCCPQYTIKLDALQFTPSKRQRKLVNRWNRFVLLGNDEDDTMQETVAPAKSISKASPFSLVSSLHSSEFDFDNGGPTPAHKFEVTLEPSSYTDEKFALYESYQREIHNEGDKDPYNFTNFLVESPLHEPIPYTSTPPEHLPTHYGSYHQMYRLDGELIAVGVIDVLPNCVSSVYFMWEKKWEKFSLGKLSALREASLAREIHDAGVTDMAYLYMGFYIYSCQKMRYKGDYSPSYLADPEEYSWIPLEKCKPLLEKYRYACFVHPEHSIEGPATDRVPAPQISQEVLQEVLIIEILRDESRMVMLPMITSPKWQDVTTQYAVNCVLESLRFDVTMARSIVFYLNSMLY